MKYKFNVGDYVKVVRFGYGVAFSSTDEEYKIIKRGIYSVGPGYIISPGIGNSKNYFEGTTEYSSYAYMIGETTFELSRIGNPFKKSFEF